LPWSPLFWPPLLLPRVRPPPRRTRTAASVLGVVAPPS